MSVRAYNDLPASVLDFLVSFEAMDAYEQALTAVGLPSGDQVAPRRAVEGIVTGDIPVATLPQTLERDLKLESEKARALAVQIAGRLLLPIAPVVGDVEGAIRSWGGDPADFADVERIEIPAANDFPPVTFTPRLPTDGQQAAPLGRGAMPADSPPPPTSLRKSLARGRTSAPPAPPAVDPDVAALFAASAKWKEESLQAARADAQALLVALNRKQAEDKRSARPAPPLPKDLLEPADAAEVQAHAAKAEQAEVIAAPVQADVPHLTDEVVAASGLTDPEQRKRLANIVDARLRDVRDAYGTRADLEKPAAAGGLGLSGRAVADLMERIEKAADAAQAASRARMAQDRTALAEKGREREREEAALRQKEEQLLARRYAELTGKAPTQPIGAPVSRVSAAVSPSASITQAARRIDAVKVKQAVEAATPASHTPRLPTDGQQAAPLGRGAITAGSLSPSTSLRTGLAGGKPAARPRMQDVRPAPRLMGPADELAAMSLTEFRRLSKDPKTAVEKIIDKVDLLEKEDYKQRLAAVEAWRSSPLNRWYVAGVREAMARGMDIGAMLREKRAAGADVPSDLELKAVVDLNSRLRF